MSYNNIGLPTPRGSGTSGYIQRNYAAVPTQHRRVAAVSAAVNPNAGRMRTANPELLLHQKKRNVELKCAELEEKMEAQGYSTAEIEQKVDEYRQQLLQQLAREADSDGASGIDPK